MSLRGMRTNRQMNSLTELLGCGVRNTEKLLSKQRVKIVYIVSYASKVWWGPQKALLYICRSKEN